MSVSWSIYLLEIFARIFELMHKNLLAFIILGLVKKLVTGAIFWHHELSCCFCLWRHILQWRFESQLHYFQSNILLMCLGREQIMAQMLGFLPPLWETQVSSSLLSSLWPRRGCSTDIRSLKQGMGDLCSSHVLSLLLSLNLLLHLSNKDIFF